MLNLSSIKKTFRVSYWLQRPLVGSGAVSKWVICACDSLVDFGTV